MVNVHSSNAVRNDVVAAVNKTLRNRLGRYGFEHAVVKAGEDHDGDPALFIDAKYRLSKNPVDSAATFAALNEIREKLLALGEERFPHIRHEFAEGQKILGVR